MDCSRTLKSCARRGTTCWAGAAGAAAAAERLKGVVRLEESQASLRCRNSLLYIHAQDLLYAFRLQALDILV